MSSEVKELQQEEVFSYIDKELKKERGSFRDVISQKTRSNFLFVFVIDIIALFVATSGFYAVYNIFQERSYNMVSTETIKGMDDIIFKEKENKGQKELEETRAKMQEIQERLKNMEQEKAAEIARREQELKSELDKKLQNLSAAEQTKARQEYEAKIQAEKNKIAQDYQRQQSELQKNQEQVKTQLSVAQDKLVKVQEDFQKKMEEISNQIRIAKQKAEKEAEERIAQKERELRQEMEAKMTNLSAEERERAKKEYEAKIQAETLKIKSDLDLKVAESEKALAEERSKSAKAIQAAEEELEKKRKAEAFNFQVNVMFKRAITSYRAGQYNTARANLANVVTLYDNKPADIAIPAEKIEVDKFFVDAINDYLTLKQSDAGGDQKKLQDIALSMGEMRDLGRLMKAGNAGNQTAEINRRVDALRNKLPDVFVFVDSYDGYQTILDDIRSYRDLQAADNLFNAKNYEGAINSYSAILRNYPRTSSRNQILTKLSTSALATGTGTKIDTAEETRKSAGNYNAALAQFNNKNYEEAVTRFGTMVTTYPNSQYVPNALDYIKKSYEAKLAEAGPKGAVDLTKLKEEQNANAKTAYNKALAQANAGRKTEARDLYSQLIKDYPLSEYVEPSMKAIIAIGGDAKDKTEIDKKAQYIYNAAVARYNAKDYQGAIKGFQNLLTEYPESSYTKNGLDYIDKSYANLTGGGNVNLQKLKVEQNEAAKDLYAKAEGNEKAEQLEVAKQQYAMLLMKYPMSDYIEKSVQGIERVILARNKEVQKTVEETSAAVINKAVGRVTDTMGNEIMIDIYKGTKLNKGDKLLIYRNVPGMLPEFVGEADVSDVSPIMSKAKITKKNMAVRIGDLIYTK